VELRENKFPPGWDEERVQRVLDHYEQQTEEEAVVEDESLPDGPDGRPTVPGLKPWANRLRP
jgi:hypothetical protein